MNVVFVLCKTRFRNERALTLKDYQISVKTVSLISEDLERFKDATLEQFTTGVAEAAGKSEDRLNREIGWLQTELEQIYRFVVLLQKREPSMAGAADLWGGMVAICDTFARQLSAFSEKSSSARISYDRILDLRRAAEERRQLHTV
jgi:hypothetical protein